MTDEELRIVTDKLIFDNAADKASMGIFQYGGGADESFIKANKAGLQFFAAQILQASINSKAIVDKNEAVTIPLEYDSAWIDQDSHVFLQYIELHASEKHLPVSVNESPRFAKDILNIGCFLIVILLTGCVILGLGEIIRFMF